MSESQIIKGIKESKSSSKHLMSYTNRKLFKSFVIIIYLQRIYQQTQHRVEKT